MTQTQTTNLAGARARLRLRAIGAVVATLSICPQVRSQAVTAPPVSAATVNPSSQTSTAPASATARPADTRGTDLNRTDTRPQRDTGAPLRRSDAGAPRLYPLTEFQQMVAISTGRDTPIFGASLFSAAPSTFAPVDDVNVGPSYIIGPGDELRLQLSGQVNQQYTVTVDRTGAISLPEVGTIRVAGLPYGQLGGYLHDQVGRIYRNFDLSVNLGALRTIQVFVVGQARTPGSYSVSSLSTLLNALFVSGGPTPQGSLRDLQVKRGGQTITHFDLYDLLLRGDKSRDIALATGDVIFIPTVGSQVAVVGSVRNPAIYELKPDDPAPPTIAQVLELAGGRNSVAADASVRVERIYEHTLRSVEDVSLASGATQTVRDGDIVSIAPVNDRFRDAVTLRGNVANPGRFVWHPGMHVSDLIPNRESLITRNYWRRRNALGQIVQEYSPQAFPAQGAAQQGGSQQGGASKGDNPQGTSPSGFGAQDAGRQGYGEQAYGAQGSGTQASQGNLTTRSGAPEQSPRQTDRSASASDAGGASIASAITPESGVFAAQTDVVLSAPDINWDYAVIERQDAKDLTTSLLPFNLGKIILAGDPTQNLELLPGDVVTIFSKADLRVPSVRQTRVIRLEGEFAASGIYTVLPGETLRGLLRRAGGFTTDAYLYGSEFTRESTRRVEQQRLHEYADQLEAQISNATSRNQARAVTPADQAAALASQVDAQRAVARLRAIQPIGRIVLDLKPDSMAIESIPDLALEDGDRFIVPRLPSSVTVEGQVYSANAFVFTPGRRVLDYLREAGGPDRQADRKRSFVLRADGSVVSSQYTRVDRARVFAGDTIVVPPVLDNRSTFQRIVDIATIIGQLGVGIGTIAILTR